MDFVVLPDHVRSHELVLDLGGPEFDMQGFQGYALRQGWDVTALREGNVSDARDDWNEYSQIVFKDVSPEDIPESAEGLINAIVGPFIQTWILFGILSEALRRPVFRHEVSRNNSTASTTTPTGKATSTNYITVQHLFGEFCDKQGELKEDLAWATHLSHCLREAAWILNDLDRAWEVLGGYILPVSVHLALSLLVQTLDNYSILFCAPHLNPVNASVGRCRPLELRLLEKGRCPNMVRRVGVDLDLEGLYYASLIPDFGTGQDHDNCDDHSCVASNVEKGNYRVQHVLRYCLCQDWRCDHQETQKCQCKHIEVLGSDMAEAFNDDGYPLIKFTDNRLEVVRYNPGIKYVAISHVWSDGRGNENYNALPTCQLETICQYVAALEVDQEALFWIDTLCVPIQEPLRNTAIMRMAPVYTLASHVLVLSEELLVEDLPYTPDQALFWIFCSKWMGRLWTMQEAALANDLVFQFTNKSIRLASLADAIETLNAQVSDQSRLIGMRANIGINPFVGIRNPEANSKEPALVDFWKGLRYRSTSRPLDVVICGSILTGADLAQVLASPYQEKMQTFWLCQMTVPASILWCNGPRLKVDGFRWAPSDLMNPVTIAVPPYGSLSRAVPLDTGLLVNEVEAISFESFSRPTEDTVAVRFSLPGSGQKYYFIKGTRIENETWAEMEEVWNGRAVLLLAQLPDGQAILSAALVMPLSAIEHRNSGEAEDEPISARYLTQVVVLLEGGENNQYVTRQVDGFDHELATIKYRRLEVMDISDSRRVEASRFWSIS